MEKFTAIISLFPSILILALGLGAFLLVRKKEKDRVNAIGEAIGEEGVAWQRIKEWLRIAAFAFVTDAEREYGALSGLQKQSYVLAKVIDMLPPELRGRIRADVLLEFIEGVLAEAKEQWAENDALLNNGVGGELIEGQPIRLIAAKDIAAGDAVELVTAFAPVGPDEAGASPFYVGDSPPETKCPEGHHWVPGFISVQDAPTDADKDLAEEAAPAPKSRRKKPPAAEAVGEEATPE